MTIAVLRYYLLVTVKNRNEDYVVDLTKLRNIALTINWSIIAVFISANGVFLFLDFDKPMSDGIVRRCALFGLPILILVATVLVYYRMDFVLKMKWDSSNIE
jgi:hypothetical protein